MAKRRGSGEGSVEKQPNRNWRTRRAIGPRGAQTFLSATASTRRGAVDLLAEKVAAFERGLDLELTPDITLIAYLRWWTDVELVEQVEDGIITATTRKTYVGQVNNHIVSYPAWAAFVSCQARRYATGRNGCARTVARLTRARRRSRCSRPRCRKRGSSS